MTEVRGLGGREEAVGVRRKMPGGRWVIAGRGSVGRPRKMGGIRSCPRPHKVVCRPRKLPGQRKMTERNLAGGRRKVEVRKLPEVEEVGEWSEEVGGSRNGGRSKITRSEVKREKLLEAAGNVGGQRKLPEGQRKPASLQEVTPGQKKARKGPREDVEVEKVVWWSRKLPEVRGKLSLVRGKLWDGREKRGSGRGKRESREKVGMVAWRSRKLSMVRGKLTEVRKVGLRTVREVAAAVGSLAKGRGSQEVAKRLCEVAWSGSTRPHGLAGGREEVAWGRRKLTAGRGKLPGGREEDDGGLVELAQVAGCSPSSGRCWRPHAAAEAARKMSGGRGRYREELPDYRGSCLRSRKLPGRFWLSVVEEDVVVEEVD
ncbi:hypothetical protein FNV43_RR04206 [Rhamnella rubrinervis]|uniref:Uncharacterized protein n=1 Tax=Rhamnella rubrinervis TaxID=2594499 RepID=A0A8K0HLB1_9ROSA|nr:hypothetical protein FNV43_RR04206 [Rhamnella rubrinervis]